MNNKQADLELGAESSVRSIAEFTLSCEEWNTPVRVFTPVGKGPFPALFFFHAGGFIGGDYNMDYHLSGYLCGEAKCVVVCVDYLLAPAHPWPAAHNEIYAVMKTMIGRAADYQIDPERVAVGGSSAGANLAASICVRAKREGDFALRCAALVYPPLDMSAEPLDPLPEGFDRFMTPEESRAMNAKYLPNKEDARDPLASPALAEPDCFPPLCLFAGERDSLSLGVRAFAQAQLEARNEVLLKIYTGVGHAFLEMKGMERYARDCRRLIASHLIYHLHE